MGTELVQEIGFDMKLVHDTYGIQQLGDGVGLEGGDLGGVCFF